MDRRRPIPSFGAHRRIPDVISMHIVNIILSGFNKRATATQATSVIWPIDSMYILNKVDAIISDKQLKEIKCCDDMRLQVTHVINNNVIIPKFLNNVGNKI